MPEAPDIPTTSRSRATSVIGFGSASRGLARATICDLTAPCEGCSLKVTVHEGVESHGRRSPYPRTRNASPDPRARDPGRDEPAGRRCDATYRAQATEAQAQ